jgi:hypothetical protein
MWGPAFLVASVACLKDHAAGRVVSAASVARGRGKADNPSSEAANASSRTEGSPPDA